MHVASITIKDKGQGRSYWSNIHIIIPIFIFYKYIKYIQLFNNFKIISNHYSSLVNKSSKTNFLQIIVLFLLILPQRISPRSYDLCLCLLLWFRYTFHFYLLRNVIIVFRITFSSIKYYSLIIFFFNYYNLCLSIKLHSHTFITLTLLNSYFIWPHIKHHLSLLWIIHFT